MTAEDVSSLTGNDPIWIKEVAGVHQRHFATNETASYMGAKAIERALQNTGITYEDLDAVVCASGTAQQPIPCTASLIQEQLGKQTSGTPCFDINSTCLSFVTALDLMSHAIQSGAYKRIVIVSTEISSVGLNNNQKESSVLFGDAACAVIVERSEDSCLLSSHMVTYSEGAHFTEIRGGGTMLHGKNHSDETKEDFLFDMNGPAVFKLSLKRIDSFMGALLNKAEITMEDIDMVVPHQASGAAMTLMQRKLGVPPEKFMRILERYGNTIASSIPLALHHAIHEGKIQRGDKVLLLGTSAGLSIGGVILVY